VPRERRLQIVFLNIKLLVLDIHVASNIVEIPAIDLQLGTMVKERHWWGERRRGEPG
jgi:hypothetical protein